MSSFLRNANGGSSPVRSVSPIHLVKPLASQSYAQQLQQSQSISLSYSNSMISPSKFTNPAAISALRKSMAQTTTGVNIAGGLVTNPQEEVDLWRSRCNDLETSLCKVNTDLELATFKAKKAKELEGKVDEILRQNVTLLGENDVLSKQFSQKRTEADIWKSKYDAQMNTIVSLKANYEAEIKRLHSDLTNSRDLYDILQQERLKESQESKQQLIHDNITHLETLKRSHHSNVTLFEEQLRKTREVLEEREKDVQQLQTKLVEAKNYGESESNRLNEDKALLRMRITQLEVDQQRELENQKRRSDALSLEQVSALKKLHESELDIMDSELNKLKNLLELKNAEIQQLIQQNKAQKRNFDTEIQVVRDENEALKEKILENNRFKELEIEDIQTRLARLHATDIANLKSNHESHQRLNLNEQNELKRIIISKSEEIENQIREKAVQREAFNVEVDRLHAELRTQHLKYEILERERAKDYEESTQALNRANTAHIEFSDQQRRQTSFLEEEMEKLKQLLVHKNNEIDVNIAQHKAIKANLEDDIRNLKLNLTEMRSRYEQIECNKNAQIDELRNKNAQQDLSIIDRGRKLEAQIDYLENELKRTRENLQAKSEESNNNSVYRNLLEAENKKLNIEIDTINTHLVLLEKHKAQEIAELRMKLENSNSYTIDTIKNSHSNQVDSLHSEIGDLKAIIDLKDRQLEEKADQYTRLERALADMKETSDLSEYQARISKLGAEVATTKNLYDVFVKVRQPISAQKIMPNNSGVSPHKRGINKFD